MGRHTFSDFGLEGLIYLTCSSFCWSKILIYAERKVMHVIQCTPLSRVIPLYVLVSLTVFTMVYCRWSCQISPFKIKSWSRSECSKTLPGVSSFLNATFQVHSASFFPNCLSTSELLSIWFPIWAHRLEHVTLLITTSNQCSLPSLELTEYKLTSEHLQLVKAVDKQSFISSVYHYSEFALYSWVFKLLVV